VKACLPALPLFGGDICLPLCWSLLHYSHNNILKWLRHLLILLLVLVPILSNVVLC